MATRTHIRKIPRKLELEEKRRRMNLRSTHEGQRTVMITLPQNHMNLDVKVQASKDLLTK
jgi:hypothetical protein